LSRRNLRYGIHLVWDKRSGGEVTTEKSQTLKLDIPVEFGGEGRYPCPDELFLSSVGGCLLTTFLFFKNKLNLHLDGLSISVNGTIDRIGLEGYRVTGIEAEVHVETKESEKENAEKCVEMTKTYCHITRTLEKAVPIKINEDIKFS